MGVFVNSGIGGQLLFAPESTYGQAADLSTTAYPLEFNSETIELKKTIVQGQGIHSGGLHNRGARRVLTNYTVSGGVTVDLPTRYLNPLLWLMFGSKANAAAQLTAVTDDTGAYSATHAPGSMKGISGTFQKGVPSVDGSAPNPFTYVGMKVTDWTLSVTTGAIATLALTFDGRNELAGTVGSAPETGNDGLGSGTPLNPTVPALATWNEATDNNVFHFREATLYTGGQLTTDATTGVTTVSNQTVAGNIKSAEIKYAMKLDTSRYFLGSNGFKAEPIDNGYRDITGQFVVEWLNSEAMYSAFATDTPTTLELSFVGPEIGTSGADSEFSVLIPQVFLEGESPKISGPAVVTQTVPFTGLDDQVNNPIQAFYQTEDAS